jgi:hypothetical protein
MAALAILGPDGAKATVHVPLRPPSAGAKPAAGSYVESQGVVAVEAEHYARALAPEGREWLRIPGLGRTLSGMTALPVVAPPPPAPAPARPEASAEIAAAPDAEGAAGQAAKLAGDSVETGAEKPAAKPADNAAEKPAPQAAAESAGKAAMEAAPDAEAGMDLITDLIKERAREQAKEAPPEPAQAAAPPPARLADLRLEYDIHLFKPGQVTVRTVLSPTQAFRPGQGLRYAVSIDDETPQIVDIHDAAHAPAWATAQQDNAVVITTTHKLARAGAHVLKFWSVDPGVVLQRLVVDAGGWQPTLLGPLESPKAAN